MPLVKIKGRDVYMLPPRDLADVKASLDAKIGAILAAIRKGRTTPKQKGDNR